MGSPTAAASHLNKPLNRHASAPLTDTYWSSDYNNIASLDNDHESGKTFGSMRQLLQPMATGCVGESEDYDYVKGKFRDHKKKLYLHAKMDESVVYIYVRKLFDL